VRASRSRGEAVQIEERPDASLGIVVEELGPEKVGMKPIEAGSLVYYCTEQDCLLPCLWQGTRSAPGPDRPVGYSSCQGIGAKRRAVGARFGSYRPIQGSHGRHREPA
jgi:hypothetical protein